jgi:hypothetical protein
VLPYFRGKVMERLEAESPARPPLSIAIASTFTVDPLGAPLGFWMETLQVPADIALAPYGQLMQELLNPASLLAHNKKGINILLIRLEDWIRDRMAGSVADNLEHLCRVSDDLLAAMGVLRTRTSAPMLIFLCPSSTTLPLAYTRSFRETECLLIAQLGNLAGVHCWSHADMRIRDRIGWGIYRTRASISWPWERSSCGGSQRC